MEQIFRQWIGMHRAMIAWYHAAHHVTKGTGFGGDHINIYGEIYTQLDNDLDMIVEKGIGLTGDETLADPVSSLSLAATLLAKYPASANQPANAISCDAFEISKTYVNFLEQVYTQFESSGCLSLGLDDLLQSLANQYETYVYLLQQRSRGAEMKITETKLRKIIRKAITESIFKSRNPQSVGLRSAGDDRYQDLARAYHQIGGKLVNGRELGTVPSDKQEVIDAIEDCREWTRNYLEETGRKYPPTDDQTPWTKEYLAANPNGNMGLWHLRFIAMWCRMEAVPAYETDSLLDHIKNDKRYNQG